MGACGASAAHNVTRETPVANKRPIQKDVRRSGAANSSMRPCAVPFHFRRRRIEILPVIRAALAESILSRAVYRQLGDPAAQQAVGRLVQLVNIVHVPFLTHFPSLEYEPRPPEPGAPMTATQKSQRNESVLPAFVRFSSTDQVHLPDRRSVGQPVAGVAVVWVVVIVEIRQFQFETAVFLRHFDEAP